MTCPATPKAIHVVDELPKKAGAAPILVIS